MNPLKYKLKEAFFGLAPNHGVDSVWDYLKDAVKNGEVRDENSLVNDIQAHNEYLSDEGVKPFNKHDIQLAMKMLPDALDQFRIEEEGAGGAAGAAGAAGGATGAAGGDSGGEGATTAPAGETDSEDAVSQRQIGGFALPLGFRKCKKDDLGNCKD